MLNLQAKKSAGKKALSIRKAEKPAVKQESGGGDVLVLELATYKTYFDHKTQQRYVKGKGYRMPAAKAKALLARMDDNDLPIFIIYDPDREKKRLARQRRVNARNAGVEDVEFDSAGRGETGERESDEDDLEEDDPEDDGLMRLNGVGVVEV